MRTMTMIAGAVLSTRAQNPPAPGKRAVEEECATRLRTGAVLWRGDTASER